MSNQSSRSRLTTLGCLVLAGGLLLPPGASAQPTLRPTPILDAARAAATRNVAATQTGAGQPAATTTNLREGSFFKSKAGIVTLLVFGGGVAFAVYSSSNDRIRSTGR